VTGVKKRKREVTKWRVDVCWSKIEIKAHRLLYHSTLGSRVTKKNKKQYLAGGALTRVVDRGLPACSQSGNTYSSHGQFLALAFG